ncbi:hypothetical protein MTCOM_05780 [Moorella thermoacetica]|uniref:DUF6884 domain-containing protein n=1 Tax=Neomoorella thermoacetica TaxID=1525 RepID=UPI000913155E|nr:DUF6884 domain-containing protein [Moorella thermoacetica]OIQ10643.1 hypothetical protein MOOTH_24800 [Moorella thermoacetica]
MSKIALISCTSRKKAYKCPARQLYWESPRFRLAYAFAKLVANKIFILSAKHGLVPEDRVIEPYNETLIGKSARERREWGDMVLSQLSKVSDVDHDDFIVLAGEVYHENLLPHLSHFWLPLKGKRQGEWIPELDKLIKLEKETDKVLVLHMLFNTLPRLDWTMIDQLPYQNGIYIMFEKGESYNNMDRIVRVGTHRGQDRLKKRLRDHFVREDADSSIFRKNIGRTFLNMTLDPYLQVWEIDMHKSQEKRDYGHLIDERLEAELEAKISQYLRSSITFVCFPVDEEEERLRLEAGIIATLNSHPSFGPSNNWLGLNSPVPEIAGSGLWNRQGLDGQPLSANEVERIKWLARFGNDSYRNNAGYKARIQRAVNCVTKTGKNYNSERKTADDIRKYIDKLLQEAKRRGEDYIDLVSGDIHKQLGMKNRMPQVCRIMYEKMQAGDKVIHTTPSGKSSTIKIRYYLK